MGWSWSMGTRGSGTRIGKASERTVELEERLPEGHLAGRVHAHVAGLGRAEPGRDVPGAKEPGPEELGRNEDLGSVPRMLSAGSALAPETVSGRLPYCACLAGSAVSHSGGPPGFGCRLMRTQRKCRWGDAQQGKYPPDMP